MFGETATLPFQAHSATSREAADSKRGTAKSDKSRVFGLLSGKLAGLTDEEMQRSLQMNPNTQRPRRIELMMEGKIRNSGKTRKTSSGRPAVIWEVVS
jgi:hypothetical protein